MHVHLYLHITYSQHTHNHSLTSSLTHTLQLLPGHGRHQTSSSKAQVPTPLGASKNKKVRMTILPSQTLKMHVKHSTRLCGVLHNNQDSSTIEILLIDGIMYVLTGGSGRYERCHRKFRAPVLADLASKVNIVYIR